MTGAVALDVGQERRSAATVTTEIERALGRFISWLDRFGEASHDHQSFFAGPVGRRAKALYYRNRRLGTLAVAPIILVEAVLPQARRLFWRKMRFPIADAHYAMGFARLAEVTGDTVHYRRAVHFLETLEQTRAPGYRHAGWGYPFDWVTCTGVMAAGTPLITTTPYVYEAFAAVHRLDGDRRWLAVMESAAAHAAADIPDRVIADGVAAAGYNPDDRQGVVINASAYRAFLLNDAAQRFGREDYRRLARRNLAFVLGEQQADGSWCYAADGLRTFVDHFHTCFVLKALAKIERLSGPGDEAASIRAAITRGVDYYVRQVFDASGLPKPFARAPRLTVYRQELYDYAECLNLGSLLAGRFPLLDDRRRAALADLLARWQKPDGSFRSRRLMIGWDTVPMHRWAQAQVFHSLCQFYPAADRPEAA